MTKFDMPKVKPGLKDSAGRPINCAGYAFVHVKSKRMAEEMLRQRKVRVGKLDAEIKPYDQAKRDASIHRHEERLSRAASTRAGDEEENSVKDFDESMSVNAMDVAFTGTQDWTEEDNGKYWDNHMAVKMATMDSVDPYLESAYVSDANDEDKMSLSASVINSEASAPVRRGKGVKPNPIQLAGEHVLDQVMKKFTDDGITPTCERMNAQLSSMGYSGNNVVEMNPIQEQPSNHTSSDVMNSSTLHMNLFQAQTQIELHEQNKLDRALTSLSTAPAAINYQITVPQPNPTFPPATANLPSYHPTATAAITPPVVQQPANPSPSYLDSELYQVINNYAELLRKQNNVNLDMYSQCHRMWYEYYMQHPSQAQTDFVTTATQFKQSVIENVPKYQNLV